MKKVLVLVLLGFIVVGCEMRNTPKMTPMEIQSLQTRDFESSKDIVFPSVVSVFQDIGYTITSADIATGLVVAESTADSNFASKFWLGISNVKQTKANAFIEEIGDMTKVRINFVNIQTTSDWYGQDDRQDTQILDAEPYRNAFEKIENAIFVRSGS